VTGAGRRYALVAFGLVAMVGACSSPTPDLYTIAPAPGAVTSGGPKVIVLQRIEVARYLDRSEIVRSSESYRLDVLSNDWWGEPLTAMLSRVLVEELSQRLPQSTVLSDSGAVSATPDATIALNVQRLDQDMAGVLVLLAQASVTFKARGTPVLRSFRLSVPPTAPGVQGEVAAISVAVGLLADRLAAMIVAGQR
jgi:uncharacterized lipoprotein YmbA